MLSPEERALPTEVQDRLLALYIRKDEAIEAADRGRVRALREEIVIAEAEREELRASNMADA
jgi:hypothetical protein